MIQNSRKENLGVSGGNEMCLILAIFTFLNDTAYLGGRESPIYMLALVFLQTPREVGQLIVDRFLPCRGVAGVCIELEPGGG